MKIIPFMAEHMDALCPGEYDLRAMGTGDLAAAAAAWDGYAATVVENGRVLGIAGVTLDEGVGQGFLLLSDELRARRFALHRMIVRGLDHLFRNGFDRIEVSVHKDFRVSRRWVGRLGFHEIGTDGDYMRYSRNG